jgi:septum formation protein
MTHLVLASRSPRRAEILTQLGVAFIVDAANLDESPVEGESPREHVLRLATAKCLSVAARHGADAVVLGADTTVDVDGEIFGTPRDIDDARQMLLRLAGRTHHVHTAVCVTGHVTGYQPGQQTGEQTSYQAVLDSATVTMTPIAADALEQYLLTGESLDKAGAYAVQGQAGVFVAQVSGDLSTVIGLPIPLVQQLLRPFGLLPPQPRP